MSEKKSGLKKLFSGSSKKDCCSIEIEEVKPTEGSCCDSSEKDNKEQWKED